MPVRAETTDAYDGQQPFPAADRRPRTVGARLQLSVTVAFVVVPLGALAVALWLLWGHGVGLADVLLATGCYLVTGFGVTIGFHRGLTHRSFTARPALRVALAVAGSMSFQGDVITWVATHRQHHAFADRPGDPHSPYRFGTSPAAQLRGLVYAHVGWLFGHHPADAARYAPDLVGDRHMAAVSRAFLPLSVASLGLPALAGWAIGGWPGGLSALLWAGLVRVCLLQHVTWSVNSLCHLIGTRPFSTRRHDRATNLWPLALLSFGESWHNTHHADPSCARHGVDPGQLDPSAGLIRVFERLGWVSAVRWPDRDRLAGRRQRATPGAIVRGAGAGAGS
jgi:stearoyl-CoA desaturase (Delta-9 desaturase)